VDNLPLDGKETTSLLKNRPFRRLWISQFCTVAVLYSMGVAAAVLAEEQTQSSVQTGLVILSSILPAVLASLVAGAVVDRRGRVPVLMASHLTRALFALVFWASTMLLPPGLALAAVYLSNVVGAALAQFALPAEFALVPDLVGQMQLTSANALLQLGIIVAEGLGVVLLAPLIVKLAGAPVMGLVGATLYLLGLAMVATLPKGQPLPVPGQVKGPDWEKLRADLRAGWQTIAQDRLLRLVTTHMTLAAALLLVVMSLIPGLASRHLGIGVEDAPFLILPGGVGFVVGSALVSRLQRRLSQPGWIVLGLTGLGLGISAIAVLSGQPESLRLWLVLPPILGVGLTLAMIIIPARTVLQERPPPSLRGRVIAAQLAMGNAAAILPLLLGGTLADHLGIRPVMGVLGLATLAIGLIGLRYTRRQEGQDER
jgi:MFS family permease